MAPHAFMTVAGPAAVSAVKDIGSRLSRFRGGDRGRAQEHLPGVIDVRVDEISQLFDTLDPFPFRERDLDASIDDH